MCPNSRATSPIYIVALGFNPARLGQFDSNKISAYKFLH